jgi:hypothetical protein
VDWLDRSTLAPSQLAPVADRRLGAMADGAGALRGDQAMERCLAAGLPSGVCALRRGVEDSRAEAIHTGTQGRTRRRACLFGLSVASCTRKAAVQRKLLCRESCCSEFHCLTT